MKPLTFAACYSSIVEKERASRTKGVPIPGTANRGRVRLSSTRSGKPSGVIGNSRIIPHRYIAEGDNGKAHRREVKRREKLLWVEEAKQALMERD